MTNPEDLETRLKIAKSKLQNKNTKDNGEKGIFIGNAFKLGTELVAAVAVGSIIGFILDNWFGTKPILIIIFFLFGFTLRFRYIVYVTFLNFKLQIRSKSSIFKKNIFTKIIFSNLFRFSLIYLL